MSLSSEIDLAPLLQMKLPQSLSAVPRWTDPPPSVSIAATVPEYPIDVVHKMHTLAPSGTDELLPALRI